MIVSRSHMATNVDMNKKKNETVAQLVRRFSRAFRDTGVTYEVRGRRYYKRDDSELKEKTGKLRRISDSKKYNKLRKEGKM
jgi:ribosomal protein S21